MEFLRATTKMPTPSDTPSPSVPADVLASLDEFKGLKILVVGDLFLDEYQESEMYEVSKEGPIPVVRLGEKKQWAGASGNLASSIRNLGAEVSLVAITGDDDAARVLRAQLEAKGIGTSGVLTNSAQRTFTYTKLRSRVDNSPSQEILRMDVLPDAPLDATLEDRVIDAVRRESNGKDVVVVLDQIDHLVTRRLLAELPSIAQSSGALLHGSSRERVALFRSFDLVIPNDREAHGAVGGDLDDTERLGRELKQRGGHAQVLLTLGAEGMAIFSRDGDVSNIPSAATSVSDVTGAGDAVSSVAALGNAAGWSLHTIARVASESAAIAVSNIGTHHVSLDELRARLCNWSSEQ